MANDNKGLTPMMRQFFEMKSKHPERCCSSVAVTSTKLTAKMRWRHPVYSALR